MSVEIERIESAILYIRNQKVLLDEVLAQLYQVETRMLTRAVRRNRAWRCSRAYCVAAAPFRSTSRSCVRSSVFASSWRRMRNSPPNSSRSKPSTMGISGRL